MKSGIFARVLIHLNVQRSKTIIYLKVVKFCGYLISTLEKKYILREFNFAIWWLQKFFRVLSFAISVKIKNERLIEYQFFYY